MRIFTMVHDFKFSWTNSSDIFCKHSYIYTCDIYPKACNLQTLCITRWFILKLTCYSCSFKYFFFKITQWEFFRWRWNQQLLDFTQGPIVWCRLYPQNFTHQGININNVDRLCVCKIGLEGRAICSKKRSHFLHIFWIITVSTLWKS